MIPVIVFAQYVYTTVAGEKQLEGIGDRERKTKREKRVRDSVLPERVAASLINVGQIPRSSMMDKSPRHIAQTRWQL
jgi:hypothetical protein